MKNITIRPWGEFETLLKEDGFLVKKITINKNKQLSLQYHNHREEHWVVVQGEGLLTIGTVKKTISKGDSIYIPLAEIHRIKNIGEGSFVFIETQIGSILMEEDIVRLEDDYHRK